MNKPTPKYLVLVQWIQEQIANKQLTYGDKFYSEIELSKMFDVSRQTVRQAVGLLEQKKVLERRRGSGTYVVFRPDGYPEKTMNIGVVSTYLDHYIFPSIIKGIENVLTPCGYTMQMAFTHNRVENERHALRSILDQGVDGIIVEPTKSALPNPNIDLYNEMVKRNIPMVFFNAYYPTTAFPKVVLDDFAAGKMVTDYLISQGHTDIAGVFQLDDMQGHLRYAGYLSALMEAGIATRAERVIWYASEELESFVDDEARLLERIRSCSAAFCYNDELAFHVVKMLNLKGISVPNDMSIISIDNSDLSQLCDVQLTSVNHPSRLIGETAANNLLKRIEDSTFDANSTFEPELIIRNSVRKNSV